jgi:predicted nucleic acid-binding protein
MATMAVDPTFVDTNILVNANVATAPFHAVALQALESRARSGVPLWISRQILREYLATLSRPQSFTSPQPASVLVAQIRSFEIQFQVAEDGPAVTTALLQLIAQTPVGGRQIHDANIVATMQVHAIRNLLTFNVSDFKRFASIITISTP